MTDLTKKSSPRPNGPLSERVQSRLEHIWKLAYGAKSQDDLKRLYAEWAATYDEDHEAVGFFGHMTAAGLLARHLPEPQRESAKVLDAGAGTGAAGTALRQFGFRDLTAVDLSQDMLNRAARKGLYKELIAADLGFPIDGLAEDGFDAAVLVGVFSYGQAPNYALDEVLRVVKPGGLIVFTMRTDFFEGDEMWVRSKLAALEESGAWEPVEVTDPEPYLPKKDPGAMFRVWCYRALPGKRPPVDGGFAAAVRAAFSSGEPVKRLDHRHIWNTVASRLYDRYIERPEYYLNVCEEEILRDNAGEIVSGEQEIIELGCGSARKVSHLLAAAIEVEGAGQTYIPIDLSAGALHATREEVEERFDGGIAVEPKHGPFQDVLPGLSDRPDKLILFFGSSIGNFETVPETVEFLHTVRKSMKPGDRFVVGADLDKDEKVLRAAYEAGEPNRSFFLNTVRRMNTVLGGDLDLAAFRQESPYLRGEPYKGIENRCVHFRLVTDREQRVKLDRIGFEARLDRGEAIQVGISRKFRREDIARLAEEAGLRLGRQWVDSRGYFSLNELVPAG